MIPRLFSNWLKEYEHFNDSITYFTKYKLLFFFPQQPYFSQKETNKKVSLWGTVESIQVSERDRFVFKSLVQLTWF